jgi:2-hydroxy-6-oxonona-2,4-dienedioate hydrolase
MVDTEDRAATTAVAIDGTTVLARERGSGPPLVLTPGGRLGMTPLTPLAGLIAERFRVFEWDRRNTGAADVWFGMQSEQDRWADDLAHVLDECNIGPAILAGGSAGARVSYLTAIRHPDAVRALVLWSVSGGPFASQNLGYEYHTMYVNAALRGGMEAVAHTPFFADRIRENPANEARVLEFDVGDFVEIMLGWNESFYWRPDMPVIGATEDELRAIRCPTLVFAGNDLFHPAEPAQALHRLIAGSELADLPWTGEEWTSRYHSPTPARVIDLYPRLVPRIFEFLGRADALSSRLSPSSEPS